MVETFGDAQDGREPPQGGLIRVVESGIGGMMGRGLRFAIVIAHQPGDDNAFAALEAGNVAVHHQIFSMFVMAAMANHVSGIVQ